MSVKRNLVHLSAEERAFLEPFARSYRHSARERTRARILLLADEAQEGGSTTDVAIGRQLRTSAATVERVRRRYVEGGLERALFAKEQERRAPRRLDGVAEAHLIALTCGAPPEGYQRWSLRLLRDTLIEQGYVDAVSHEAVRRTLKKKRAQAVGPQMLVHSPEAERRVRLPHGGRARRLPAALRSDASAGLSG